MRSSATQLVDASGAIYKLVGVNTEDPAIICMQLGVSFPTAAKFTAGFPTHFKDQLRVKVAEAASFAMVLEQWHWTTDDASLDADGKFNSTGSPLSVCGKVLLMTDWLRDSHPFVLEDEVPLINLAYACIGKNHNGVLKSSLT